jgi:hypothetical protein
VRYLGQKKEDLGLVESPVEGLPNNRNILAVGYLMIYLFRLGAKELILLLLKMTGIDRVALSVT